MRIVRESDFNGGKERSEGKKGRGGGGDIDKEAGLVTASQRG